MSAGIFSQIEPEAEGNNAFKFNTANSDYINMGTNIAANSGTVMMWVIPSKTTFNGQNRQFFATEYKSVTNGRGFSLEFFSDGRIRAVKKTSGYFEFLFSQPGTYFQKDTPYHIAFTAGTTGGTRLYVNSVLIDSTSNTAGFIGGLGDFTIGGAPQTTTNNLMWFDGIIHDIAVFNTERTQAQIASDMTRVWTGTETGLKMYLPGNGTGATVTDINNNYTGVINTTSTDPNYIDNNVRTRI